MVCICSRQVFSVNPSVVPPPLGATDQTILIVTSSPIRVFTYMEKSRRSEICYRPQVSFGESREATSLMRQLQGAVPHASARVFLRHLRLVECVVALIVS